ncbi:hypothetical protein QFZ20_002275 [Flavobacterium sp. W4I14]|nr:hypothetical protein [Flavobacterium sp. W4I14]
MYFSESISPILVANLFFKLNLNQIMDDHEDVFMANLKKMIEEHKDA